MSNPDRIEDIGRTDEAAVEADRESRKTHGYHQELDRNNNGIPDYLESNPANDDVVRFSRKLHPGGVLTRDTRRDAGMYANTISTAEPSQDYKGAVQEAKRELVGVIEKEEASISEAPPVADEIREQIKKARHQQVRKVGLARQLSRFHVPKEDHETGLSVVKAAFRGALVAAETDKQNKDARKNLETQEKLEGLHADLRLAEQLAKEKAKAEDSLVKSSQGAAKKDPASSQAPSPEHADHTTALQQPATNETSAEDSTKHAPAGPSPRAESEHTKAGDEPHASPEFYHASAAQIRTPAPPPSAADVHVRLGALAKGPAQSGSRLEALQRPAGPLLGSAASNVKVILPDSPLLKQARNLPLPSQPVSSKGPNTLTPRMRAVGIGIPFGTMIQTARANSKQNDATIEFAYETMRNAQDNAGRGR